ncbi:MAG: hypothetical protein ANABAC_1064 [Anaerolineae bacterium]|nr:MAG: hypothetical protein ANABAC_1064 [Anaerolineae bacterium]
MNLCLQGAQFFEQIWACERSNSLNNFKEIAVQIYDSWVQRRRLIS